MKQFAKQIDIRSVYMGSEMPNKATEEDAIDSLKKK